MDVPTLTMPADEARQRYDEYRDALATREPTDEDRGILLGYKALAAGRAILDLHQVFRGCPLDGLGRPALAVGRADWRWCHFAARSVWQDDGRRAARLIFARERQHLWYAGRAGRVIVPPPADPAAKPSDRGWRAMVPIVPPNLRPAADLRRYHILWEAEWELVPTDPLLLGHLHGTLYAVLAAWDLTPLERAVLAGRLTEAGR